MTAKPSARTSSGDDAPATELSPDEPEQPPSRRLVVTATTGQEFVRSLEERVGKLMPDAAPKLRSLEITLIGDQRMARLHEDFAGAKGTTDVLTFPLETDDAGHCVEAEIYLCVPVARRAAGAHGNGVDEELLLYALHGLLHLAGHDDHDPADYDAMHNAEATLLAGIGLGHVTVPGPQATRQGATR